MTSLLDAGGDLVGLGAKLVVNWLVVVLLLCVYLRRHRRLDHVLTFVLLNTITFLLCYQLSRVRVGIGVALGLFGVFGVLRFRTEGIAFRDLTYLFVFIGVALLNALASYPMPVGEWVIGNAVVVIVAVVAEGAIVRDGAVTQTVVYDDLELLARGSRERLVRDLEARTGLEVVRVAIQRVDLVRQSAEIEVVSRPRRQGCQARLTRVAGSTTTSAPPQTASAPARAP